MLTGGKIFHTLRRLPKFVLTEITGRFFYKSELVIGMQRSISFLILSTVQNKQTLYQNVELAACYKNWYMVLNTGM